MHDKWILIQCAIVIFAYIIFGNLQSGGQRNVALAIVAENPSSICTSTTSNNDCIFKGIHLNFDESKTFGLNWKNNLQKHVTFINSSLTILPKSLFEAFPQMESLNAEDLQIEEIEHNAFQKANRLIRLYLNKNLLSSIKTFRSVPLLIHLDLSSNKINHINYDAFERSMQLKRLILSHNQVLELPSFHNVYHLEEVNLTNNELRTISDKQFSENQNLQYLDISNNKLSQFNLQQLNDKLKLTFVNVSNNKLASLYIPDHIQNLDARNNSINDITANVCALNKLYLSNNQISDVSSLRKCTNLYYLDLSHNQLKSFDLISSLPKLNYLNLAHNKLFEIDTPIRYYHPLQFLDVSYNFLSYVPANKLSKLRIVKLNNNKFIYFKFFDLRGITFMKLSSNEWNCAAIEQIMLQIKNAIDDNQETCNPPRTISKNGICCRNYLLPFLDRLKEHLREYNLHENINKKDLKEACKPSNPINKTDFGDSVFKNILQQINNKVKIIVGVYQEIEREKIKHSRLEQEVKNYQNVIEKLQGHYGVAEEELKSSNLTLNRVIQYTQKRNRLSIDLLARRKQEKKETEVRLSNNDLEKSTLMYEIDNLNALLAGLKEKEKIFKSEWSVFQKEILQAKDDSK